MPAVESVSVFQVVLALAGSSVLGATITELLRKVRSKEDKAALHAVASRDHAQGEAAVIASMAAAFTGTTGALREEVERMQSMLNELRSRVVEADRELRAAAAREADLERQIVDLKSQLATALADAARLRAERNLALERVIQQEGEVRQDHAVIDALKRAESKT